MQTSVITASAVELALVARRLRRVDPAIKTRWAAMSAHVQAGECRKGNRIRYAIQTPSLATPMQRGGVMLAIERTVRWEGTRTMRRIFGAGIQAMRTESRHVLVEG